MTVNLRLLPGICEHHPCNWFPFQFYFMHENHSEMGSFRVSRLAEGPRHQEKVRKPCSRGHAPKTPAESFPST